MSSQESIRAHHAHSSAQSPGSSRAETPSPSPSHLPSPSAPNEFPSQELNTILELDLTKVWEQVMRVQDPDSGYYNRSLTPSEESRSSLSTITEEEQEESEDEGEGEIEYNPATYGLSPDSLIRERLTVEVAKNGTHSSIVYTIEATDIL